jgi:hypothetical protein
MPGELKLLPCPFCGGKAFDGTHGMQPAGGRRVSCLHCQATATSVTRWNRRAIPVEESQHVNQFAQPAICPQCGGMHEWENPINRRVVPCPLCNSSGKLQAGAQ